jgi:hypothetical protein
VPLPKKEAAAPDQPPPPEGIDALGKPFLVIVHKGVRPSMVAWKFNSNKMGYFGEGEFLKESKNDKDRFKLIDVLKPDPKADVVSLVYEIYDDPKKPPVATKTGGPYDLGRKFDSGKHLRPPAAGTAKAGDPKPGDGPGGAPAGPGAAPPAPPVAVRVEDLKPVIRRPAHNKVEIEFDDAAYEGFRNVTVEDVLNKVRTEDVVDSKTGQRTGVRIADTGGVASAFDVRRGDILKSINGTPVKSRDEAVKVVKGLPKETTTVSVVIERDGADVFYTVDPRDPKVRAAANRLRVGR